MDIFKYRVDLHVCYDIDGQSSRRDGYEIVYAGSLESARLAAKARAMQSLKKQGAKIVFLDIKDPVRI